MEVRCAFCGDISIVLKNYKNCPYCGKDYQGMDINIDELLEAERKALDYRFKSFISYYLISLLIFVGIFLHSTEYGYFSPAYFFLEFTVWIISIIIARFWIANLPKSRLPKAG